MKRIISILVLVSFLFNNLYSSDEYKVGDELFVWAKSGLNLRLEPSTKSTILISLPFGETVTIIAKSNKTFNVTGVLKTDRDYHKENVDPIIFKGNWVQVKSSSGKIGFVIDQYLLSLKPKDLTEDNLFGLQLDLISMDTTFFENNETNFIVKKNYGDGIIEKNTYGDYWGSTSFIFPNSTFEEALIRLGATWDLNELKVIKNWKETIELSDNEICTFSIYKEGEAVIITIDCSC